MTRIRYADGACAECVILRLVGRRMRAVVAGTVDAVEFRLLVVEFHDHLLEFLDRLMKILFRTRQVFRLGNLGMGSEHINFDLDAADFDVIAVIQIANRNILADAISGRQKM